MKLIIAGSRTVFPSLEEIDAAVAGACKALGITPADITLVIEGEADGADAAGKAWALARGYTLHKEPITPEDWKKHGRYLAPKMRNRRMAQRGDFAVVFWDGTSGGSADMVARMVVRGKRVFVAPCKPLEKNASQGSLALE